ncbi:hypothetical protein MN116_008107 [Schistosoma mekongi]|uniref:Uncharacterized protein n=1 Tax=Schistosoma mekongi TaxID=38744 RepID=A0AAE2D1V8_SCHME|nr:hypothetical protein MN116_008107 [Schistosoma mekongi]
MSALKIIINSSIVESALLPLPKCVEWLAGVVDNLIDSKNLYHLSANVNIIHYYYTDFCPHLSNWSQHKLITLTKQC